MSSVKTIISLISISDTLPTVHFNLILTEWLPLKYDDGTRMITESSSCPDGADATTGVSALFKSSNEILRMQGFISMEKFLPAPSILNGIS